MVFDYVLQILLTSRWCRLQDANLWLNNFHTMFASILLVLSLLFRSSIFLQHV
jgi:hypothetical protein